MSEMRSLHREPEETAIDIGAMASALLDGRYQLKDLLGEGGMGKVHLAEDVWLDRMVAIKVIDPSRTTPQTLVRFKREARALAQIRHNNVVQIYAFGLQQDSYYFAMEYVNGKDLGTLVDEANARGRRMPFGRALEIVRDVARGLEAVHARGIVHRDIKPSNIVIESSSGRSVLIDFGLARPHRSSPHRTMIAGTPSYMAPEQTTDVSGTETTARSDLYALACTAFELFAGRSVFEQSTLVSLLRAHLESTPPSISSIVPDLAPLDPVLRRAMAKSPAERYPSCAAFTEALDSAARRVVATSDAPRVRVVLLHRQGEPRRRLSLLVERVIHAAGDVAAIDCVETYEQASAALTTRPADLVVVDDEVSGSVGALVEALRHTPGFPGSQVIVLARAPGLSPHGLGELTAHELPKPFDPSVLTKTVRRATTRIAERRRKCWRAFQMRPEGDPPPGAA